VQHASVAPTLGLLRLSLLRGEDSDCPRYSRTIVGGADMRRRRLSPNGVVAALG
jgi:hypothetical protein